MTIKNLALGCVGFSTLVTLIGAFTGFAGLNIWSLVDVALLIWFGYEVYRNQLWAALTLAIYWTFNFICFNIPRTNGLGIVFSAFIMVVYWLNYKEMKGESK